MSNLSITEISAKIREEVNLYKADYRVDNSAFLIWFLRNIFKLTELESVDAVVDGPRDKGIDAIWVNEQENEIYVFQSEFSPSDEAQSGDTKIREFAGVMQWFKDVESVQKLQTSSTNEALRHRLTDLSIESKIAHGNTVIFVYVTNKKFDNNATEYLATTNFDAYEIVRISDQYVHFAKPCIKKEPITLAIDSKNLLYDVNDINKCIVASISAKELMKLEGLQDQSLFSQNVRLWSGNTRVNKDLMETIKKREEHKMFFLYHNGISITCSQFDLNNSNTEITIKDYQVINGCQSLTSLYQNKHLLTDDIKILVKIIQVSRDTVIQKITKNANNQNAISLKDLKSNDRVQIELQNTFKEYYGDRIFYTIKRGEDSTLPKITIDMVGQLIKAFYFGEPEKTHLKTKFYGEQYEKIFNKDMNCHKIYLANLIFGVIEKNKTEITSPQVRDYGLAKYTILSSLKKILENDPIGKELIDRPDSFLTKEKEPVLIEALTTLFKLVALDLNDFIEEYSKTDFFDYKNLFKKKEFCEKISTTLLTDHKKNIIRHPEDKFEILYTKASEDIPQTT